MQTVDARASHAIIMYIIRGLRQRCFDFVCVTEEADREEEGGKEKEEEEEQAKRRGALFCLLSACVCTCRCEGRKKGPVQINDRRKQRVL